MKTNNTFEDEALSSVNKVEITELLLKSISNRLAGRTDCRNIEYTVSITWKGVDMYPLVYVYPNRHRKHESDKLDIVSYIHRYKLQNITLDQLEFGTYRYQIIPGTKRRRWIRIV